MAGSRLERIGTIFTRVTGLLQSRVMTLDDRPVWYDVYKTFPPALPPRYDRPIPNVELRNIFYPEDAIRAKFHKHMGRRLPTINLSEYQNESPTGKVIELCNRLQSENQLSVDEAFDTAIETLGYKGSVSKNLLQKQSENQSEDSIANSFKQASSPTSNTVSQIDIKSILKDE